MNAPTALAMMRLSIWDVLQWKSGFELFVYDDGRTDSKDDANNELWNSHLFSPFTGRTSATFMTARSATKNDIAPIAPIKAPIAACFKISIVVLRQLLSPEAQAGIVWNHPGPIVAIKGFLDDRIAIVNLYNQLTVYEPCD